MSEESDFYVGYLPQAASALRQFLRKVVFALALLGILPALALVLAQMPFANSYFEFGKERDFEGTLITEPYPELLVRRPGQTEPTQKASAYLLVGPGKHGADALVRDFAGKEVHLRGQLIYRDGRTMVEVEPSSIHPTAIPAAGLGEIRDLGPVTLNGEIVDSKCYLGVMNPGQGKVHRDCASRCLSGGIPPLFIESDNGRQFLLVAQDGRALRYEAFKEFIAEPISLSGELVQRGDTRVLGIDPSQLRHNSE